MLPLCAFQELRYKEDRVPPHLNAQAPWRNKHGTLVVMATIEELSTMEKSNDSRVAQCGDRRTHLFLRLHRPPRRQMDASPSSDFAWKSGASLPRSSEHPSPDQTQRRQIRCAELLLSLKLPLSHSCVFARESLRGGLLSTTRPRLSHRFQIKSRIRQPSGEARVCVDQSHDHNPNTAMHIANLVGKAPPSQRRNLPT